MRCAKQAARLVDGKVWRRAARGRGGGTAVLAIGCCSARRLGALAQLAAALAQLAAALAQPVDPHRFGGGCGGRRREPPRRPHRPGCLIQVWLMSAIQQSLARLYPAYLCRAAQLCTYNFTAESGIWHLDLSPASPGLAHTSCTRSAPRPSTLRQDTEDQRPRRDVATKARIPLLLPSATKARELERREPLC